MADYWIKLYLEILDDPKMATLPDRLWRRTIEIFLLAGKLSRDKSGQLPDTNQLAWLLRMPTDDLYLDLQQLSNSGLIKKVNDGWKVVNFEKRQEAVTSTERSRHFRKKEKANQYYGNDNDTKGIYKITCTKNNRSYIGSSIHCEKRIKEHFYGGKTFDDHWMFDDLQKYGAKSFTSEILERVENDNDLPERETFWISKHGHENLYNSEYIGKQHRDRNATNVQRNVAQINRLTESESETESETEEENKSAAAVFDAYMSNIGQVSPVIMQKIQSDIDEYSAQWVLEAIEKAVVQEKRSLGYVQGVLKGWKRDGKGSPKPEENRYQTAKVYE